MAAVEAAAKSAQSAGDNAWMLVSSALVLMMTGPGLALFYGGLVRRKNVLGTMMHSFVLMAVVTVLWAVVGYSLAFGGSGPVVGNFQFAFLDSVGSAPNPDYAGTIPQSTFMVYQLMFAIITPALISGAFAERMKVQRDAVVHSAVEPHRVLPMAHMVWGKGGLLNAFSGGKIPCFDFAGGTVVHITSGVSALVCALVLGKRVGYPNTPMKPHNLVLSVIGACLLWVGWFGFNAGSALAASGLATSAFVATHFGAAAAALAWMARRDGMVPDEAEMPPASRLSRNCDHAAPSTQVPPQPRRSASRRTRWSPDRWPRSALPALNPNQPTHSRHAPITLSTRLCGFIGVFG